MATLDNIVNQLDEFEIEFKVLNENVRHIFDKNNTLIGQGRDILREIRRISNRRQPAVAAAGSVASNNNGGSKDIVDRLDQIIAILNDKNGASGKSDGTVKDKSKAAVDSKIKNATAIVDAIAGTITEIINIEFEKTKATFQTTQKVFDSRFSVMANTINKSLNATMSGIFKDDLVSVAYDSYGAMLDIAKENFISQLTVAQDVRKYELEVYKLNTKQTQAVMKGIGDVANSVGNMTGGVVQKVAEGVSAAANLGNTIYSFQRNLSEKEQERFIQYKELINDAMTKVYESAEQTVKIFKDTASQVTSMVMNIDKEARKVGLSMGLSGANLEKFVEKQLLDATDKSITQFGKTAEDLIKTQASYQAASERNVLLTADEQANIFSLEQTTGIGAEEISKMLGEMHKYNIAVGKGSVLMHEMYGTAAKLGINANKMAQNFANNIKLASKVNFKDGVQSIKEMTAWSMKTRFNMESIAGMVDKIVSGGIEDIISSAAQLNVLGGNAAMYSDPLGMLYGAIDAQDLAERLSKSIEGLGTYNKETGETTFNLYDRQIMQRIAAAYGKPAEELDIMIRTQKQLSDVAGRLSGKGFTEEQIDLINANAKFNKELNAWQVSMFGAKGVTETKNITELQVEDLEKLVNKDAEQALVDYAAQNLSETTKQAAAVINIRNILAQRTFGNQKNVNAQIIADWNSYFEKNQEELVRITENEQQMTAKATRATIEKAESAIDLYWDVSAKVNESFENVVADTDRLAQNFRNLNRSIEEGRLNDLLVASGIVGTPFNEKAITAGIEGRIGANKERDFGSDAEKEASNSYLKAQKMLYEHTSSMVRWQNTTGIYSFLAKLGQFYNTIGIYINKYRIDKYGKQLKDLNQDLYQKQTILNPTNDDAVVQFHKDDEIIAGKRGGGIHNMMMDIHNAVVKSPISPVNSGNSVRGMFGAGQQNVTQNITRQSVPWKGELTVKLESKDGKTDITNLVRNTDGMRTLMDSLMKTLAKETSGFGVTSDMILKNYRG